MKQEWFSSAKNLSNFVVTDNGYFFFGTNCNLVLPLQSQSHNVSTTAGTTWYDSALQCTNTLISILADDYYLWYITASYDRYYGSEFDRATTIVPSAFLMCPNLLSIVKEGGKLYNGQIGIYFPTLKKLVRIANGTVLDVYNENNGNFSLLANSPQLPNYPGMGDQAFFGIVCFTGYDGTKESLLDHSKMFLVQCSATSTPSDQGVCINSITNTHSFFSALFNDFVPPDSTGILPPPNPYEPGGPSAPGDLPPGTFDDKSDPIPDSSLPTLSAANTGFTRIYNPTLAQVRDLANYLWTDESALQTIWNKIKQYFEDPMQAIIGFNLVPVTIPDGGTEEFKLMYIPTGVQMTVAASQFVDVDCGTVKLERYYGSALDQSPYTKVSCYMPYIGTVQLDTDEVMGAELQVKYRVDVVTGSCVAKILVDGSVIYQYSGHCAINIPISSSDFSSYMAAAIGVAKLAIGAAAGGATGAVASSQDADQQTNNVITTDRTTTTTERNPVTGRQITTGTVTVHHTRSEPVKSSSTKASYSYLSPANIANTVGQVMASKPNVEHSGSFSGNSGYLGIRRPFLIIERPNMCLPESYQQLNGFPAMITMELSTCKGFTKVQQIQLTGLSATNPEQAEIMGLLKSGVFF